MAVPVENQVEGDMFSNLHADTEVQTTADVSHTQSQALIRKCLHPPSAVPEFCGLPTNDARSQVCIEWRNMELNDTPLFLQMDNTKPDFNKVVEATPEDLKKFSLAFLIPNGARVNSIGFVYNPTIGRMTQDFNGVSLQQLYDFKNWRKDVNLFRTTYKSTTFYLNATAFNDTGMVVGNQFNPNILFSGDLISMAHEKPMLFYSIVKSAIKHNLAKIIQRPTREQTEKWERFPHYHRSEIIRQLGMTVTDIITLDPDTSHQILSLGLISSEEGIHHVPTTSQILGNSLRSLGCKAKEGMFSINRLNTITPSWLAGSNTYDVDDGIKGLYQCWVAELVGDDGLAVTPLYENAPVGTDGGSGIKSLYDTMWSKDMTFSWVKFDGLSLNVQNGVSTQLIIKKSYVGFEVQPCPASAWAGMIKLGPKPDLNAMQAMMDGFYELKDVMPARYNFWGTIASLAAQGAKTFGTTILSKLASQILGGEKRSSATVKQSSGPKPNRIANKGRPNWAESGAPNTASRQYVDKRVSQAIDQMAKLGIRPKKPVFRPNVTKRRRGNKRGRGKPTVIEIVKPAGRPSWANK